MATPHPDNVTNLGILDVAAIRVNGTKVVDTQQTAIADWVITYTTNDPVTVAGSTSTIANGAAITDAEVAEAFDEVEAKLAAILAAMRAHGIIAT